MSHSLIEHHGRRILLAAGSGPVIGEVPAGALQSQPPRDFIAESNRRGQTLFVPDLAALEARLG
ncbi:MAG TPA: hypothetical protein VF459_11930 [Caulobacteraceae bacterium]